MSDVTEADRERAWLLIESALPGHYAWNAEQIAETLADEREKARAPFLALADEISREAGAYTTSDKFWTIRLADRIRRAAEDT